MKKLLIPVLAMALGLAGCGITPTSVASAGAVAADTVGAPAPSTVANKTVLDEKAAIGLETAYTVAAKAATTLIRAKVITDPATIKRIGDLDNQAFLALAAVRAAYRTGNATSYVQAFNEANVAIAAIRELL
jgi:hypothetical protein